MKFIKNFVEKLPVPVEVIAKRAYNTCQNISAVGNIYRKTKDLLKTSQYWSSDKLHEYQSTQLTKIIYQAYQYVPYYRNILNQYGLTPGDIKGLNDLHKIPFLTKPIIQDNIEELKAANFSKSCFSYVTTGGSTGIPMGFFLERGYSDAREWAFMENQWERVGYHKNDRCIVLRGSVISSSVKGVLWKTDPVRPWLIMSSYHLTDENMPKYLEKINEFKPKFIQAYPSAITIMAQFIKDNNVKSMPEIQAILCGSENLYGWQRNLLQEVFGCRVYSWYGHAEQAVLAGECEKSTDYHIFSEYGIVEVIGKDGKQVQKNGEIGEVVVTGLQNLIFPFIRYRTMDFGTFSTEKCSCGRSYPLLKKINGRMQEIIITHTGRQISMTAINMHSDVFDNVRQFQFYQDTKGFVVFNIIKKASFSEKDIEKIRLDLQIKLGPDMELIIKFVDDIPRTQRGKYRFLIQKLPVQFGD